MDVANAFSVRKVAQKREQALLKLGEQKAKMMWQAGAKWEKEQVSKIQKKFKPKR